MIKNIKNLGISLSRTEQKEINGGLQGGDRCNTNRDCWNIYPFLGPGDVSSRRSTFSDFRVCVFN